jgi:hypothetical protein
MTGCIEWYGCYYFPPPFEIGPGFISSLVLTSLLIVSILYDVVYDKLVLRQLYKTYLPMYAPKKHQNIDESDEI